MKLFKKTMAIALAGVLALTVLTGCGKGESLGFNTSSLANAMTDVAALWGTNATITADSTMDAQAKTLAAYAETETKDMTLTAEEVEKLLEKEQVLEGINQVLKIAPASQTSPLYILGVVEINDKITSNDAKVVYYADALMDNGTPLNDPNKEWDMKEDGGKALVGTASAKIAGKDYIIMLLKTSDVEAVKD